MTRFEIDGVEVTTDIAGLKFNDANIGANKCE